MIIPGILASSKTGHLWAPSQDYVSISTATVTSGGTASVTFSSIPTTYTHLQIRGILRSSYALSNTAILATFNSDSGSNYAFHQLVGNGSTATASSQASNTSTTIARGAYDGLTAGIFTALVMDIFDYTSTSKNKTVRTLSGYDSNSSDGQSVLYSGLWFATPAAINRIDISSNAGNLMQYSQLSLYGIR